MRTTGYLALSRQAALERDMAMIANNLANATTTGYRAEQPSLPRNAAARRPSRVAFDQERQARDLAPGPIAQTGNRLDVALDGPGYLAFAGAGGVRYGRAGRLEIDADGRLVNVQAQALLDESGNPITLPLDDTSITIAGDGTVSGRQGPIGRIGIATFVNERTLQPTGGGMYSAPVPPSARITATRLVQGALEGSNVQPVLEMTAMVATVRAFEGAQQLLDTQHDLERQAIERTVRAAG